MPVPGALLVAALIALGSPAPDAEPTVRVAAAADLKFVLEEVAATFRKAHPGVALVITYGSSGNLFAQIESGAPFDLFLSADIDDPRRLEAAGLVSGGVFSYATGRLALCVPASSPLPIEKKGLASLLSPGLGKLAIANPRHAPYGRAAEEAMKSAGVLDAVRSRLVLGENVSQAAQFVQSGAADAGLVALSLALSPATGIGEGGGTGNSSMAAPTALRTSPVSMINNWPVAGSAEVFPNGPNSGSISSITVAATRPLRGARGTYAVPLKLYSTPLSLYIE